MPSGTAKVVAETKMELKARHIWGWTLIAVFYVIPLVLLGVALVERDWLEVSVWTMLLALDIVFVGIGRSSGLFDIVDVATEPEEESG